MSGYCRDCGNTLCICADIAAQTPKPAERCYTCERGLYCAYHPAPESPAPNAFDDNRNPITLSVSNGEPQAPAQGEVRVWKFVREYTNSPRPHPALQNELRELLSAYDALRADNERYWKEWSAFASEAERLKEENAELRKLPAEVAHWKTHAEHKHEALEKLKADLHLLTKVDKITTHRIIEDRSQTNPIKLDAQEKEITRLRAELAEAKRDKDTLIDIQIRVGKERDEARAEAERAKAANRLVQLDYEALLSERDRFRTALEEIKRTTSKGTHHHEIARQALDASPETREK